MPDQDFSRFDTWLTQVVTPEARETLRKLAARVDDSKAKPYTCTVCDDSGLVVIQRPEPYEAHTGVVRCLCERGQRQPASVDGKPWASVADFWPPETIESLWPHGVPAAASVTVERLLATGFALAHHDWTFNSYHVAVVAQDANLLRFTRYAEAWVKRSNAERPDVVIYGGNGTGKTGLGVCMLRGCFDRREDVLMTTARALHEAWVDRDRESELFQRQRTASVLFIDELGGMKASEFVIDALTSLVDARQKSHLPTIITMNTGHDAIALELDDIMVSFLGAALYDRLKERGQFWPLLGESKRKPRRRGGRTA